MTQGQWKQVMGNNLSKFKDVGDDAPVEWVSWHDCTNFMAKLSQLETIPPAMPLNFRLPTEAQWEYACRAGTDTAFHYGNDLDSSMANFNANHPYGNGEKGVYREETVPVGQFKPNAWGLYDMHGNVWEWCADKYGEYEGDATDPSGYSACSIRVIRGGCWYYYAGYCRSAYRGGSNPDRPHSFKGFRLSLPTEQQ